MEMLARLIRNNLIVMSLGLLLLVEVASLMFIPAVEPSLVDGGVLLEQGTGGAPLKISEIDGPRIDSRAAMVVIDEKSAPAPRELPLQVWAFLLLAYVALILFNFSYTFETAVTPQWFWETFYTFLALLAWFFLDPRSVALWFPFAIVKIGLIIFILYAYLLEKKRLYQEYTTPTFKEFV